MKQKLQELHNKFMEKYEGYFKWHQSPNHNVIHWFILLAFITVNIYFLAGSPIGDYSKYQSATVGIADLSNNKNKKNLNPEFSSNQLLIKIKSGAKTNVKDGSASDSGLSSLIELDKTKKVKSFKTLSKPLGWYIVEFEGHKKTLSNTPSIDDPIQFNNTNSSIQTIKITPELLSLQSAKNKLMKDSAIELVEYNYKVEALAIPTDPMWSGQWDMTKISAPQAWDTQTNTTDTVVAVIDTGIDFTHPDLQANLWTGADGSHGYTCINGACVIGGQDDQGHGTHVAGTIGATANNNIGIAGINWNAKMIAMKFLDANGSGYLSDAVYAFQKLYDLKQQGLNVRVTNNSWGGGGYSQALKDSMLQLESVGVVDVCAAGNSGLNTDVSPMYPAAYNNRGIVSVLATDLNDIGAYFTNYGLANTDIAAPGVSTLSTVPTGSCALCDPTGYRPLSGTSMASPHVAGVMTAIMHRNPNLTSAQARDLVLNPGSYDAMTNALAGSTSSGGRLNFFKAITNPNLQNPPPLNNFPIITGSLNAVANAGGQVNLNPTVTDADGDAVRRLFGKKNLELTSGWMLGAMLMGLIPDPSGNSLSFTAPPLSRIVTMGYGFSATDNKGGGASSPSYVTVLPATNGGLPPTGQLSLSATDIPVGGTVTVNYPLTDPDDTNGQPPLWSLWLSGPYMLSTTGWCCSSGTNFSLGTFTEAGVYRISAQGIDEQLNFSTRQTAVLRVGGATGEPPFVVANIDKTSGPVPLTVTIDLSGSYDPDGSYISTDIFNCADGVRYWDGSPQDTIKCTFSTPGLRSLTASALDSSNLTDTMTIYIMTTPSDITPPEPDTEAPTIPTGLSANVISSTQINLSWTASTDNVGVVGYKVYRNGTQITTTTTTSYQNTGLTPETTYSYTVRAYDSAGNTSQSSLAVSATTLAEPLTINSQSVSNLTVNSAKINWTTNLSSTGTVKYGLTPTNLNLTASSPTSKTSHSITLTGLTKNTRYYYQVTSTGSGQTVSTSVANFRTKQK